MVTMNLVRVRHGFTRIDLTVALTCLIGFIGILLPACSKVATESQSRARSNDNLRKIGRGLHSLATRTEGLLPPSVGRWPGSTDPSPKGSLFFHLLPDVEQGNVYSKYFTARGIQNGGPQAATETISTYVAAEDPSAVDGKTLTSYATNAAVFTLQDGGTARYPAMFNNRGTANVVFVMERFAVVKNVLQPQHRWSGVGHLDNYLYPDKPIGLNNLSPLSAPQFDVTPAEAKNDAPHAFAEGKVQVLLGDGSTRLLDSGVANTFAYAPGKKATIWAWACTVNGELGNADRPDGW
jgi:hypothetical protein